METITIQLPKESTLDIFAQLEDHEHEQILFCSDPKVGLRAIIAIHNTILGPALGGTRMWAYASESEAVTDVLRLSRGMTYKAAVARLNLGGGKAVIIADPNKDKSEPLFRAYGRFVDGLGGRYITAEDVGTNVRDMEWVRMETKFATGISRALGGSGDPSPVTALGVYMGMKAGCKERYGSDSLQNKTIVIQGAGHVATYLCGYLKREGAKIFISDIYEEKAKALAAEHGASYIQPEYVYEHECDIFCPAALGGILNDVTIPKLRCDIVAGCANNQLQDETVHEHMLIDRGIFYLPDFVINAGGLINVANELEGYNRERALSQAKEIYDVILEIAAKAKQKNLTLNSAAILLAKERLEKIGQIKQIYTGNSSSGDRFRDIGRPNVRT